MTVPAAERDLAREVELQREARLVLTDLQLLPILERWGEPHLIGSLAMGLMVVRDIDFNVLVPHVDAATLCTAYLAIAPIAVHPRVFRLRYVSQLGPFNPDGSRVEEGFYCGIHYRAENGEPWKIDVWTLQPPRPEIALRDEVRRALTPEMRADILFMKREMKRDPRYDAAGIHSRHVYEAALEGLRTMEQFQRWLAEQGFQLAR